MFDAKSLLESLVNGASQRPSAPAGLGSVGGGLADLLGQLTKSGQGGSSGGTGGLDELIHNMMPGSGAGPGGGGGLNDILAKLQQNAAPGGGGLVDVLGQVFGQATQGVKEGAAKAGEVTGARDAIGQITGGKTPEELVTQLKELIANNQLGAGAALGGLGALILGTGTGRSVAMSAAKIGALALIGGLAYKAYQNYSQGKPLITGHGVAPEAAPNGSGFEPQAVTNANALLMIRAMVAAAAADGRVDAAEQAKILGSLKQAGLDADAEEFLANELNKPADAAEIAADVVSEADAIQVYTAARIAIEPDTAAETEFLGELKSRLGLDDKLAAHIDAAARSAAT